MNLDKKSTVLVTGGSGLVGRYLTSVLLSEGFKVIHLSRNGNQFGKVRVFRWDHEKKYIDPVIFEGVDVIVHLSGANIGEKRWTNKRKEEIINSRVNSVNFLYEVVANNNIPIKAFITASATGYYGSGSSDKIFREEDPPSNDFLGTTCRLWEEGADQFKNLGIRTVKIRTAVVLEKYDSALAKLMKPARFGFVIRTGNGKQYFPWIHISDLCNIYLMAISDQNMIGAYNAVSPQHVKYNEFTRTMASVMNKPLILPPVPAFVLKMILGEMSEMILKGNRISSEKIIKRGYRFLYKNLDCALKNIIYG